MGNFSQEEGCFETIIFFGRGMESLQSNLALGNTGVKGIFIG